MLVVTKAVCPTCGAPLRISPGQRHVICLYCDTSLLVHESAPSADPAAPPVVLTPEAVSKEDIARIKALVLDGKRDQAIALHEKATGVTRDEATKAVDQLMIPTVWALMRRMPINAFGFSLFCVLIGGSGALTAWSALKGLESPAFFLLTALAAFGCVRWIISLLVKLVSTYVARMGRDGRGRVLKCATMPAGSDRKSKGVAALVLFEVTPADGSAPFVDEEAFMLLQESVAKLVPGNVVPVRFDGARTRVFPVSPIRVLEQAG